MSGIYEAYLEQRHSFSKFLPSMKLTSNHTKLVILKVHEETYFANYNFHKLQFLHYPKFMTTEEVSTASLQASLGQYESFINSSALGRILYSKLQCLFQNQFLTSFLKVAPNITAYTGYTAYVVHVSKLWNNWEQSYFLQIRVFH